MGVYHRRIMAEERHPACPGKGLYSFQPALVYYLYRGPVGGRAHEELLYGPGLFLIPCHYHLAGLEHGQALAPAVLLHEPVALCGAFGPQAPGAVVDARM